MNQITELFGSAGSLITALSALITAIIGSVTAICKAWQSSKESKKNGKDSGASIGKLEEKIDSINEESIPSLFGDLQKLSENSVKNEDISRISVEISELGKKIEELNGEFQKHKEENAELKGKLEGKLEVMSKTQ